ncbi:MAG: hypothetical protein GYB50_20675 [Rhodobacteraceae bacterium]|nr:hypothetical protein [Paracoccaceae bacterium]
MTAVAIVLIVGAVSETFEERAWRRQARRNQPLLRQYGWADEQTRAEP